MEIFKRVGRQNREVRVISQSVRMNHYLLNSGTVLYDTLRAFNQHDAPRLAAALAFYTLLSLAPLVILAVAIAGFIFGHSSAQSQLLYEVESLIGSQGSEAVKAMIENAQKPAAGTIASLIGLGTLLFGASGVFCELRSALNQMWEVTTSSAGGVLATLRQRFLSVGMALAVGFLLLISLIFSTTLAAFGKYFHAFPMPTFGLAMIDFVVSLAGISLLFTLIFRYVPEKKIPWHHALTGATFTALLFTIGKLLIGFYLGKAAVGSAYGAAGSLVVVIVWVYYSSMIFFFGAEFTHVFHTANSRNSQSDPASILASAAK